MPTRHVLAFDIGSNSVGSAWFDRSTGKLHTAVSIFPAGVDESDDKRGEPKNAKRRATRRTRITLARRAERKRELRLKLIQSGLLPPTESEFDTLLQTTDPWELRRNGLDQPLTPFEFGRVLLHLAQRRGALGLRLPDPADESEDAQASDDDGRVKAAIGAVRSKLLERKSRTFGEFIADLRAERITPITTPDRRPEALQKGPREWRAAVRNKAASYEHCADRAMIRDEFARLWHAQRALPGPTAKLLTPDLRLALDDESGDATWRHKGLLFGQRRQTWDLGTLGRCNLHPEERCAPHADMHASRYLVVETVNNLKIIEGVKAARPLTPDEREKIMAYLSGPLGMEKGRKKKGDTEPPPDHPKRTVSITDLRNLLGSSKDGWGRASKDSRFRFNIENDEDRAINTDWFSREIIHGAITPQRWAAMPERTRDGLNRAILKFDPDQEEDAAKLKAGVMTWAGLSEPQADALIAAWRTRPKPDAKRLTMSRRAVRNLLAVMDRPDPWPDPNRHGHFRWLTQIEARKLLAGDADFIDLTTGRPFDDHTRRRYATGAKGATARDRYYMGKHTLLRDGKPVIDRDSGEPLAEPPPAPLISNPVVRKAIHEVRRHLVEFMSTFGRKPDHIFIELAREARMGKKDADRLLFKNRLRNRIRNDIIRELDLDSQSSTQQRAAVDRVILCVQQGCVCPLCGNAGLTPRNAAPGSDCELAHIIPRASGGHNGLSNLVLAHTRCNREMGRRTPRQFWSDGPGFEQGIARVKGIFADVKRPKPSEIKNAAGDSLWACYFTKRDDDAKIERFKLDVSSAEIQAMTLRQEAATKYAARQVMAYLADALFGGKGLPERAIGPDSSERRIFNSDGLWTSRLRREWRLFFDPHDARSHGLAADEEHRRKEKNRGDHRHHAIDAIVIALCTRQVQIAWEDREKQADTAGVNTADEVAMENYRRLHPLPPPAPFKSVDELRDAVHRAVYGDPENPRPVCHRPVKRKLIGALHKATQYGPVLDVWVQGGTVHRAPVEERVTIRQDVLGVAPSDFLKPAHLRMPRPESDAEAVERLARRFRVGKHALSAKDATNAARRLVRSRAFTRKQIDPKPEKGGIVRDPGLRRRLRKQLQERGLNPDSYGKADLKRSIDAHGPLTQESGVPIHRVILLWSNSDPVTIQRDHYDYPTGKRRKLDDPGTLRLYDSQNNHHVEIRVNPSGAWSGQIISAFEAAQRKLARIRALRQAGVPRPADLRKLPKNDRRKFSALLRQIEHANPIVDRRDDHARGGRFVMSLAEGEMLCMKHKETGELGYFVVAKLDKPRSIVLVPHWDARAATERKDAQGNKVPDSKREQFSITPADFTPLAPPGRDHITKVRVSPLGFVTELPRD